MSYDDNDDENESNSNSDNDPYDYNPIKYRFTKSKISEDSSESLNYEDLPKFELRKQDNNNNNDDNSTRLIKQIIDIDLNAKKLDNLSLVVIYYRVRNINNDIISRNYEDYNIGYVYYAEDYASVPRARVTFSTYPANNTRGYVITTVIDPGRPIQVNDIVGNNKDFYLMSIDDRNTNLGINYLV